MKQLAAKLILILLLATPAYAVDTALIDRDGVTTATDTVSLVGAAISASPTISTAQSATNPDSLVLRQKQGFTGTVTTTVDNTGSFTPYVNVWPQTQPSGVLKMSSGVYGSASATDIFGLWSGTKSSAYCLSGDGTMQPIGTGTVTASTTDIFTNKTLDTAGTGNVLKINGTQVTDKTGTGKVVLDTSPTLTTPNIGAATATSVVATGLIDGTAPTVLSTTTTYTLGSTYKTNYTYNNYATAGTAITYTLPTAAAGRTECVKNYTGKTGTLRVNASAAGQYIVKDGVQSASGGYVISGGALGDGACFVGVDATHWDMYAGKGTWTLN